jgi:hypothetical protein
MITNRQPRKRWPIILLFACLGFSLFCVMYPIYVIRPFRAQGESELAAALIVARFRPVITVLSAVLAVMAVAGYWRAQQRRLCRILATVGALFTCALAILARVNVYELMFHPVGRPSFSVASQAKFDRDEKVIAVNIGGKSRAYPIRSISYHHVVNDVVESKAIVATY